VVSIDANGHARGQPNISAALQEDSDLQAEFLRDEEASKEEPEESKTFDNVDSKLVATTTSPKSSGGEVVAVGQISRDASAYFLLEFESCLTFDAVHGYFRALPGKWPIFFWPALLGGALLCEALTPLQSWSVYRNELL
jgi:hypothetical protein